MKQVKNVYYYLFLSIVAAALLLVLTFFSSSIINTIETYDKLFIGGAFITSCILGISLAMFPSWFKKFAKHENRGASRQIVQKMTRKRKGHHPDCDQFQNHTIMIKNKTLCAGCLGLSIGSVISIILMIIYVIIASNQSSTIFHLLIFLGLIMIGLTYVEIILPVRHAVVHVISNIFLVISFLLITVSIFEITGNKIYGTISVIISFLWLDTRIQLSNWQHARICEHCSETCKMY